MTDILSRLEGVRSSGEDSYTARCPAHDDRHSSLSVKLTEDKVLLTCHAGCRFDEIVSAMGLSQSDLFADKPKTVTPASKPRRTSTDTYLYTDGAGELLYRKQRYNYDDGSKSFCFFGPDGSKGIKGVKRVPYNLPAVLAADVVYITEGEKACQAAIEAGCVATTLDGGAKSKWCPEYAAYFAGKDVIILPDNDLPGAAYASMLKRSLPNARIIRLPGLSEKGDAYDWLKAGHTMDEIDDLPEYVPTEEDMADRWSPPIPFDDIKTPPFPIRALPTPVADYVEALSESTQTPPEMSALLSLGVLAVAFQGRYEVCITPDWKEPLCLYTAAVAAPGERKSGVMTKLTGPVYEYEAERRAQEAGEIAQNQAERSLLEKALASAQSQAVKGKGTKVSREEVLALADELANFEDKHLFRLLVDDTTSEKLVDIMCTQGGNIAVASAEGGVFDAMAGRYDKNACFDVYLKGHAGDPITVDRISRQSNHIPHPHLSMMLTIQPDVLSGLMGNTTFRGRGLCGRFLYAVCRSKVGSRDVNPPSVPFNTADTFRCFVRRILSGQERGLLTLSAPAHAMRLEYMQSIETRLGNEWEFMRDWGGKLVGAMLRIAALIHAAKFNDTAAETPISAETVGAAIRIAECLGVHAMAAYQTMGADESSADAKYLLRRLETSGRDSISKRDLFNQCKGKFRTVDEMEPAIRMLAEMSYIREEDVSTGGRPSRRLIVNPLSKSRKRSKSPDSGEANEPFAAFVPFAPTDAVFPDDTYLVNNLTTPIIVPSAIATADLTSCGNKITASGEGCRVRRL